MRGALPTGETAEIEGVEVSTEHWIGGERVGSSETFDDVSPIDERVIAEVARGGRAEVDRAVAAARGAFDTWGRTSAADRAKVLHRIAELVEERVPELAPVETRDNGSLLRSHLNSVMPRVARNFRFFADQLIELGDEAFEMNDFVSRTEWDPSGVTVVITPWNAPLMLATWRIAPALAAGNSVVAKPPEWAPLSASILADLTREAGLPDGAFNVVQGIGEEAGAALTGHPDVDRIAFTGSIETGQARRAGRCREPHPDLARARREVAVRRVRRRRPRRRREAGGEPVRQRRPGLPGRDATDRRAFDASTRSSNGSSRRPPRSARATRARRRPTSDRRSLASTSSAWTGSCSARRPTARRSCSAGARTTTSAVCTTGRRCSATSPRAPRCCARRSSGPVLTLQTFEEEEEAIALANETDYGLAAIVYTGDRERAERVSERVVAGTVWVNSFFVRDLRAPFGGAKSSGVGREGGVYSFDFYADVKNVCMAPWPQGAER